MEFEDVVGYTLRLGVLASAALLVAGIALLMASGHAQLLQAAASPRSLINTSTVSFSDIESGVGALNGLDLIYLGLIVLIATPVSRVVLGIAQFAREKDLLYTAITTVVLFNLMFAMFILPHILR